MPALSHPGELIQPKKSHWSFRKGYFWQDRLLEPVGVLAPGAPESAGAVSLGRKDGPGLLIRTRGRAHFLPLQLSRVTSGVFGKLALASRGYRPAAGIEELPSSDPAPNPSLESLISLWDSPSPPQPLLLCFPYPKSCPIGLRMPVLHLER